MNILEHEIEDVIWNEIERENYDGLKERGLPISDKYTYFRQFNLGSYGIADLIGVYVAPSCFERGKKRRCVFVQIFELKKDEVNAGTFFQAVRYAKGFKHKAEHEEIGYTFYFDFHLIGKTAEFKSAFIYLPDVAGEVNIYTVSITLEEGIIFSRRHDYSLMQPSFKEGSNDIGEILKDNVLQQKSNLDLCLYLNACQEERAKKRQLAGLPAEDDSNPF